MGRPISRGLLYFPEDVDAYDDIRIMELFDRWGCEGYVVWDAIKHRAFHDGYYIRADAERLAFAVVRMTGGRLEKNFALQVINFCAEIGLLDKELLPQGIVTSAEIQSRWKSAKTASKSRAEIDEYCLTGGKNADGSAPSCREEGVITEETPVIAEKTAIITEETPVKAAEAAIITCNNATKERKEKESKANESKANESKANESKANESKANESKANESKANQSKESDDCRAGSRVLMEFAFVKPASPEDVAKLDEFVRRYGEERVVDAIRKAAARGGRSTAYIEKILQDNAPKPTERCFTTHNPEEIEAELIADWFADMPDELIPDEADIFIPPEEY